MSKTIIIKESQFGKIINNLISEGILNEMIPSDYVQEGGHFIRKIKERIRYGRWPLILVPLFGRKEEHKDYQTKIADYYLSESEVAEIIKKIDFVMRKNFTKYGEQRISVIINDFSTNLNDCNFLQNSSQIEWRSEKDKGDILSKCGCGMTSKTGKILFSLESEESVEESKGSVLVLRAYGNIAKTITVSTPEELANVNIISFKEIDNLEREDRDPWKVPADRPKSMNKNLPIISPESIVLHVPREKESIDKQSIYIRPKRKRI